MPPPPDETAAWADDVAAPAARTARRRRALRPAAIEALVVLVAAVAGTGWLLERAWTPDPDASRNPAFRRNWPAWIAAAEPKRAGETLVVLLGNSQGFGREVAERDVYAARLGPLVAERSGRPARVVNWAVPGGGALEYVIAAAAAHRLRPDVVLLVSGPGNFKRATWKEPASLGRTGSDLRFALADASIVERLPARFRDRFVHANDRVDAWLAGTIPLWRYRDLPRSWLLTAFPLLAAFEKDRGQDRWYFDHGEAERRIEPWKPWPASPALRDVVVDALAAHDGRAIVVRMPVHSTLQGHHPAWLPRLARRATRLGVESVDLRHALPDDVFQTASHLDARGHARLAAMLAEIVAP